MDKLTNQSRTFSICLNVAGFIKNSKYPDDYKGMFENNGKDLSPDEARAFLVDELAKGHKVIPFSSECGNPCKHADKGCTGFDYSGSGCPGRFAEV